MGQQIAGGVLILVHHTITTAKLSRKLRLAPTLEVCSTKVFPANDPIAAICISAIYLPPRRAKNVKMDMLKKLGGVVVDPDAKVVLPHILGGDFNTTGWLRLYEEWLQGQGILDLISPQVPTYARGAAIDKFLFVPGEYIPSTLLPDNLGPRQELEHSADQPFFPAQVVQYTDLSDHMPILLPIPCEAIPRQKMRTKRIRIGGLFDETWEERDRRLAELLVKNWPRSFLEAPLVNKILTPG